jgi:signal transduction histidine kinase
MNALLSQIFHLLITSPGNLVYHLVLAFALMAGLQALILQRGVDASHPVMRRYFTGYSILLIGQALLFIGSALVWQRVVDPQQFLPVLDRLVTAISFAWLAWMWAFPTPQQTADTTNVVINLALILFGGISISLWVPQMGSASFNRSGIDLVWTILELLILLAAIAALVYKRKGVWSIGLGFFLVLLAGVSAHLFVGDRSQDYPATIRLAQICVYPLLPSLARMLPIAPRTTAAAGEVVSSQESITASGRRRRILDPGVVASWLQVARGDPAEQICPALIQATARSLIADLCFLIVAPDRQSAYLQCGYDLIREERMPGSALNQNRIPHIADALQRGRTLRIPAERKDMLQDLTALAASLGLRATGDVLAAPLTLPTMNWAGIIAVSPYTKYEWTDDDLSVLSMICEQAAPLIAPAFAPAETLPPSPPSRPPYAISPSEVEQMIEERKLLLAEIESLRQEAQLTPHQFDLEALMAIQEESRATIQRLEADNLELREALQSMRADTEVQKNNERLQTELQSTLDEVVRLQNLLSEANLQILNLQNRMLSPETAGGRGAEILSSIVQELRQPVYSISGYVDLLMGESQEILTSDQITYLDRIKSSTERMKSILDEFPISPFESSPVELAPRDVDIHRELEDVIAALSGQLQEKSISVQKDIPALLPSVYGDRDALHQVIHHLLQNASNVTPPEGCIRIEIKVDDAKKEAPFLVFQVTDEGGGIAPEDLGKVFSRDSHSEQECIPGMGDSGLGLSMAKTLIEAHGGRIWVDSQPGKTTTFSLLLPLRSIVTNGYSKVV